jgi:HK97 family phage portal protein
MGLIDLITRALGKAPERSLFEDTTPIGQPMSGGIQSYVSSWAWTGKTISPDNAMEAPTVYACVRLISQTLARMPWQVLRNSADGASNDVTHPVYQLLNGEANEDMTSFVFREAQISDCLLYGNSFAFINRNPAGTPIGLERLRPDLMYMMRDPANQPYYQYWTGKADEKASEEIKQRKFRPYDILHVVGPSADGMLGEAPIHRMRDLIGMELELQEFTSRFFSQNCRPAGVLSMPGRLSAEGANRLREAFNRVHSGAQGAGKIAILEEGLKFEAISTNAKDSDLDSMKKFCRQQIAAAFNVPSHRVGDNDGVSYSSAEQANAVFVQSTLAGWAARLEQEVNRKLIKRGDDVTTRISFDDLLRGDMSTRFSAYAVAVTNGILTPNEIRAREGLPAVDGGESIRLPLNTSTPTAAAPASLNVPTETEAQFEQSPSDVVPASVDIDPTEVKSIRECGTGAGGFQPGNDCAKGGGEGGEGGSDKPKSDKPAAKGDKPAKALSLKGRPAGPNGGKPPAAGLEPPKPHDGYLPKNPKALNIGDSDFNAKQMGYKVEKVPASLADQVAKKTFVKITDSKGNSAVVSSHEWLQSMYDNATDTNVNEIKVPKSRPKRDFEETLEYAVDLFYPTALAAMTRCTEAEAKYRRGCRTPAKLQAWIPDVARIASEIAPIMRGLLVLQGHSDRASDGIAIANAFAESIKTEARNADWHNTGHTETAAALATRLIQELIQTNKEQL